MGGSKMKMVMILFLLLIILELGFWSEAEGCLEHERSALIKLKNFFNHPYILQHWVKGDCCQWVGVECNTTTGRVLALDLHLTRNIWKSGEYWYLNASLFTPFQQLESLVLSYNNIAGCIENEGLERLSRLSNLKFLDLGFNSFNSSIFSSLTDLSSLTNLDLSFNRLKGSIDVKELDSLSNNLEELDMSWNEIDKFVAPKGLSKLKSLRLSGNKLNHSILSSLTALSSLRYLYLSGTGLKGSFDVGEFNFFSNLEVLDMSKNEIENFMVPKGLSELDDLDLSGNKLNRSMLSSLTGLSSLRVLNLRDNGFKGTFDVQELDSLSNLEELDVSDNEIDNLMVPKDYRGLRKLSSLYLDGVAITDGSKVLQSMGSFLSLNTLHLQFNNFTGTVTTQELHKFTNLEDLTLDQSSFHTSLLRSIAAFTSLKRLSMSDCKVNGVLSDHQGMCDELVHLKELDISGNDLRGSLPWCLANMTSLQVLDVSSNQFTGNISTSSLIHLTSIEELTLSNNQFQIPISLEPFFNHSKLKIFRGGRNEIYTETESHSSAPKFQLNAIELSGYGNGGSFPKFLYHQHELQEVHLSHINLRGEFPNWLLENNTNLDRLILLNNSLSGPLHITIHSHMQLSKLDISKNNFQGNIPAEFGAYFPNLNSLNLSMNAFNNSIPSSFGDMNSLYTLDLSNNQLTGEIPEYLAMGCYNLVYLVLSNNNLQGHLFSNNFNLTNLKRLQLDGNHFTGEIPESLSDSIFLGGLYLSDNNISGKIPTWLGNLSLLEDIIMSNNHLEGSVPTEFCQLNLLEILDLSENNISGSLPSCFSLSSIQQVHLSKNMLQGPLKDGAFYNSSSLVTLDLSYNSLNGSIPDWIYRLTKLSYLILANNNLEGEVPVQLCQLKHLRLIDLSYNNLSGQIPYCLDNTSLHEGYYDASAPTPAPAPAPTSSSPSDLSLLVVPYIGPSMGKEETIAFTTKEITYFYKGKPLYGMYGIDFSCNKLIGEIPPQIGELTRIRTLNLSHNNLTGAIPATFSNLKQVESMDLSYNYLNGKIPPQLIELNSLVVFSVAYNNLSGKIPEWTAQFATFNESSYMGNPLLCGPPLLKSCNENGSSQAVTPKASTSNGEDDNLIDMEIFYITFTVSYVIVILGIVGVLWVNPYWRRKWFYLVETWMTCCYYFIVDNLIPTRFYRRFM